MSEVEKQTGRIENEPENLSDTEKPQERIGSEAQKPALIDASSTEAETLSASVKKRNENTSRHAFLVGAGILISRIIGVLRQRIFGYYFGASESIAADAFNAAFRIPNFLQNVFGEGALSASLIPVYAKLLAEGDEEEANRLASAILSLLAIIVSLLVLIGVLLTPFLLNFISPGFQGEKRELTIRLVRILFPGAGLLVLSAWCLGILNSHRKFFLSYTAPVIWNVAIIAAMILYGNQVELNKLAEIAAWGSVIGSGLQFAIQLPTVFLLVKRIRLVFDISSPNVRVVVRSFLPVFFSRGVVQISAYVDAMIASLLGNGPTTLLQYTQTLYTLPVSLFGMSISAAELPAMSSTLGDATEVSSKLRTRLDSGLKRIAVFIVPSSMAFLAFGDVLASALFQIGKFKHQDVIYVWGTLAGASVGLMASTLGRLYSSTFYALKDTRTPLKFAIIRVLLTTILGYICAIYGPPLLGLELAWGTAALTLTAGLAGWVEFLLLRRSLNQKIGKTGLPVDFTVKLWVAAIIGAAVGWGIKSAFGYLGINTMIPDRWAWLYQILIAVVVTIPYGVIYFSVAVLLRVKEASDVVNQFVRRIPGLK